MSVTSCFMATASLVDSFDLFFCMLSSTSIYGQGKRKTLLMYIFVCFILDTLSSASVCSAGPWTNGCRRILVGLHFDVVLFNL